MKLFAMLKKFNAKYKGGSYMIKYLRDNGISVGEDCRIFSDITTSESYLISIGNKVTISNDVQFITHDASIQKAVYGVTDIFGRINIGNNCFIGAKSIIMYGVSLADDNIVAAGSVVTKSFTEKGKIIGGNPAKVIGDVSDFAEKYMDYAVNISGLTDSEKRSLIEKEVKLVRR